MQSHPRILISTVCRDGPLYDFWGSNTPHTLLRLGGKRFISLGLRFIKQNVPDLEILEMPTADEYSSCVRQANKPPFFHDRTSAAKLIDCR
jgi:hypothetical protein